MKTCSPPEKGDGKEDGEWWESLLGPQLTAGPGYALCPSVAFVGYVLPCDMGGMASHGHGGLWGEVMSPAVAAVCVGWLGGSLSTCETALFPILSCWMTANRHPQDHYLYLSHTLECIRCACFAPSEPSSLSFCSIPQLLLLLGYVDSITPKCHKLRHTGFLFMDFCLSKIRMPHAAWETRLYSSFSGAFSRHQLTWFLGPAVLFIKQNSRKRVHLLYKLDSLQRMFIFVFHKLAWSASFTLISDILIYTLEMGKICLSSNPVSREIYLMCGVICLMYNFVRRVYPDPVETVGVIKESAVVQCCKSLCN